MIREAIQEEMLRLKIRPEHISKATGINKGNLSTWLRTGKGLSIEKLEIIMKYLKLNIMREFADENQLFIGVARNEEHFQNWADEYIKDHSLLSRYEDACPDHKDAIGYTWVNEEGKECFVKVCEDCFLSCELWDRLQ